MPAARSRRMYSQEVLKFGLSQPILEAAPGVNARLARLNGELLVKPTVTKCCVICARSRERRNVDSPLKSNDLFSTIPR